MPTIRKLFYSLPPAWRFLARRLYYLPTDLYEGLSGRRGPMTPPRGLIYTGSGDFRAQGEKMRQDLVELAGLQPHHRVLDVGSGIGRIAVPLTEYLDEQGSYEGFDVVEVGVRWCEKAITSHFPNFRFTYVSLDNDLYRSGGGSAADFRFPYPDEDFDVVVLTSVFTHMLPGEVANYLREIGRVLCPGGRCFATFFIWNEEAARLSRANPHFTFPYDRGHYRLMDEQVQAANVAYEEGYLRRELIEGAGLKVEQAHYGYWAGRKKERCKDFQDILVLSKPK
ncbi:MAG: class I SAM-dependent methyltransferase [Phaeodactylibacter sp.]|nr:class I SAM-dependent methyltransferase [Phaeodactylibacter sp.]MCB9285917.1 class I SAM-dependent methyltransferase [Lewinellaceae bacterium]